MVGHSYFLGAATVTRPMPLHIGHVKRCRVSERVRRSRQRCRLPVGHTRNIGWREAGVALHLEPPRARRRADGALPLLLRLRLRLRRAVGWAQAAQPVICSISAMVSFGRDSVSVRAAHVRCMSHARAGHTQGACVHAAPATRTHIHTHHSAAHVSTNT
jgi:hypothetical protein